MGHYCTIWLNTILSVGVLKNLTGTMRVCARWPWFPLHSNSAHETPHTAWEPIARCRKSRKQHMESKRLANGDNKHNLYVEHSLAKHDMFKYWEILCWAWHLVPWSLCKITIKRIFSTLAAIISGKTKWYTANVHAIWCKKCCCNSSKCRYSVGTYMPHGLNIMQSREQAARYVLSMTERYPVKLNRFLSGATH